MRIARTVISLRVRVPVLSEQITVAAPSVSIAGSLRTMAWVAAMRRTPRLNPTVTIAGSASGMAATASATANKKRLSTAARSVIGLAMRPVANTMPQIPSMTTLSRLPVRSSSCWSGVGSLSVLSSRPAMRPTSVAIPVATTTARPRPYVATVPAYSMFCRSPSPTSESIGPKFLCHRHAFAGQRCLVGLEIGALDDAGIGWDPVSRLEQDDVAGYDVSGRDAAALAVAHHRGFRRGQRHQRPHRLFRPRLLDEAEQSIQHDDQEDDDRLVR